MKIKLKIKSVLIFLCINIILFSLCLIAVNKKYAYAEKYISSYSVSLYKDRSIGVFGDKEIKYVSSNNSGTIRSISVSTSNNTDYTVTVSYKTTSSFQSSTMTYREKEIGTGKIFLVDTTTNDVKYENLNFSAGQTSTQSYVFNNLNNYSSYRIELVFKFRNQMNGENYEVYTTEIIDNSVPILSSKQVGNGSYTSSSFTINAPSDSDIYVTTPSGSYFNSNTYNYTVSSSAQNGLYKFKAIDETGNVSQEYSVYLDSTAPTISITNKTNYINYSVSDNMIGVKSLSCNGQSISSSGTLYILPNKIYNFIAYDKLNNKKEYSFTSSDFDFDIVWNNLNSNSSDMFKFNFNSSITAKINNINLNPDTFYYCVPNENYEVVFSDMFGNSYIKTFNSSSYFNLKDSNNLSIDNVFYTISFKISNFNKIFINDTLTTLNEINCIKNGEYIITVEDLFGKQYTNEKITCLFDNFITNKTYKEIYYENSNNSDYYYSFESYENALLFGITRENSLISEHNDWIDPELPFPGGCPIAEGDTEIPGGTYYKYKSINNKNLIVAYFSLNLLNSAVEYYASQTIKTYYYYQKDPSPAYENNNLYTENLIFNDSYTFNYFIGVNIEIYYKNTGEKTNFVFSEANKTFNSSGSYIVKIFDDFNNYYTIDLTIVSAQPIIKYGVGINSTTSNLDDTRYFYDNNIYFQINDIDEMSKLIFYNSENRILNFSFDSQNNNYVIDSEGDISILPNNSIVLINQSGEFSVLAINHCSGRVKYNFGISLSAPVITFTENDEKGRLEITVKRSADSFVGWTAPFIEIYTSTDNSSWVLINKDNSRLPQNISSESFINRQAVFNFNLSVYYKVVLYDNYRGQITAYNNKLYLRPLPVGIFLNALNDSQLSSEIKAVNKNLKFNWSSDSDANLNISVQYKYYSVGSNVFETFVYTRNTILNKEGKYIFTIADTVNNNFNNYEIIIDKTAPSFEIPVNSNGYTKDFIYLSVPEEPINSSNIIFTFTFDNQTYTLNKYDSEGNKLQISLINEGNYSINITDEAGNVFETSFILDFTAPSGTLNNVINNGYTNTLNGLPFINNFNDNICPSSKITANYIYYDVNGNSSTGEYTSGQTLKNEGKYLIYITDLAGNVSVEYSFIIDKTPPIAYCSTSFHNGKTKENVSFNWEEPTEIYFAPLLFYYSFNGTTYSYEKNQILFNEGNYIFTLKDEAGNYYQLNFIIDKTPPVAKIYDQNNEELANNSITNLSIKFNWSEENLTSKINNEIYTKNSFIIDEGIYYLTLTDEAGNQSIYTCEINFSVPILQFKSNDTIVSRNSTVNDDVLVILQDKYNYQVFYKDNNNYVPYNYFEILDDKNFKIIDSGSFKIDLSNNLGFSISYYINLTKTVEYDVLNFNNEIIDFSKATNNNIIIKSSDNLNVITVSKNGEIKNYNNNCELTEEAKYNITITNRAGLFKTFNITIDKTPPVFNVLNSEGDIVLEGDSFTNEIFSVDCDDEFYLIQIFINQNYKGEYQKNTKFENLYGNITLAVIDEAGNFSYISFENKEQYIMNTMTIIFIIILCVIIAFIIGIVCYFKFLRFPLLARRKKLNKTVNKENNTNNTDNDDNNINDILDDIDY